MLDVDFCISCGSWRFSMDFVEFRVAFCGSLWYFVWRFVILCGISCGVFMVLNGIRLAFLWFFVIFRVTFLWFFVVFRVAFCVSLWYFVWRFVVLCGISCGVF